MVWCSQKHGKNLARKNVRKHVRDSVWHLYLDVQCNSLSKGHWLLQPSWPCLNRECFKLLLMPWPPSTQGQGEGEGHSETWRNICSMPVRVHLGIAVLYCLFPRVLLLFGGCLCADWYTCKARLPLCSWPCDPAGLPAPRPSRKQNMLCC